MIFMPTKKCVIVWLTQEESRSFLDVEIRQGDDLKWRTCLIVGGRGDKLEDRCGMIESHKCL